MSWRDTALLGAAVVVAAAVDVAVHRPAPPPEALPGLPAVDVAAVRGVRVQEGDAIVEFTRTADSWRVTAPYQARADQEGVQAIVDRLASGVPMDVRVDALTEDNDDTYGLDNANLLRVDLLGDQGPLTTVYLGNDGPGGASFVRRVDDDDVYRARLGGRHRYDRPAADWRDRRLVHLVPAAITGVSLPGARLDRTGDGWRTEAGRADPDLAEDLVTGLAALRIGEILPTAPSGDPAATVELATAAGTATLRFWRDPNGVIAAADDGEAGRIDAAALEVVSRPLDAWLDRRLFPYRPDAVAAIVVYSGNRVTSAFVREDGAFVRTAPANVAVDARALTQALTRMGQWRSDAPATLAELSRVEVDVGAGVHVLHLGAGAVAVDDGPARAVPEADVQRVLAGLR